MKIIIFIQNFHIKKISIIERLSGSKGIICKNLFEKVTDLDKFNVFVIGGHKRDIGVIEKFLPKINFVGYVNNINEYIEKSDCIIGASRVAVEAI